MAAPKRQSLPLEDKKKNYSEYLREKFPPKQGFIDRMEKLLGKDGAKEFFDISYTKCPSSINILSLFFYKNIYKNILIN